MLQRFSKLVKFCASIGIITLIFGAIYGAVQQDLRQSANDPQIQMAQDAAAALNRDIDPQSLVGKDQIDLTHSLAPFLIIYDNNGRATLGSGVLVGKLPTPPQGVFEFVHQHGEERVTWQPQSDVRIAAVIRKYDSGFVLAGRSLYEVEQRENKTFLIATLGWLGSLILFSLVTYLNKDA